MNDSIVFKKVTFAYDDREMLSEASLTLKAGEKVLIVGENGAGKSTLMKLAIGEIIPDDGVIERPRSLLLYVSQEFHPKPKTVNEYIDEAVPQKHRAKVADMMKLLGFPDSALVKNTNELSGGQQKIIALSCAIAQNPGFLFLDEPENHLDIVSRIKLIEILQNFRGALIMVSHDRHTVDALAEKVFEVEKGHVTVSEGGYEEYLEFRKARIEGAQRKYDSEVKDIKKLQDSVRILGKIAFRGKGVANYQNRKAELESRKEAIATTGRAEDRKTKINLITKSDSFHSGKLICKIDKISYTYEGMTKPIIKETSLEVRSGRKIVLLGRNGSGKSTFLKCLTSVYKPTTGDMTWGNDVTWSYFNQHAEFDPKKTAVEVAMDELKYRDDEARRVLGSVKFNSSKMITPVGELSGGERMRLRFACAFGLQPDFLILDEPTNHLDQTTWDILLEVCQSFKGTLLLVSHDYSFIEQLDPDYFWLLQNGSVVERHKDLRTLVDEIIEG